MSENTNNIAFYDNHLPNLPDGEYALTFTQTISINGVLDDAKKPKNLVSEYTSNTINFYVNGPRYQLSPSDINAIFPQDGAKGDFEGTLPSISFNRSTLLWERKGNENDSTNNAPWMFLLLINEDEQDKVVENQKKPEDLFIVGSDKKITVSALGTSLGIINQDDHKFIPKNTPINFLDLSQLTTQIIPSTLAELKYLAYARINSDTTNKEEHCVLVGNRLPKPGNASTVYLISLENKYNKDGSLDTTKPLFPILHKWKFYTNNDQLYSVILNQDKIDANNTLGNLPAALKTNNQLFETTEAFETFLQSNQITDKQTIKKLCAICKLSGGSFHDIVSNLKNGFNSLDLTLISNNRLSKIGSINLPEYKIGNNPNQNTNAWYRGPLVTSKINLQNANFKPDTKLQYKSNQPLFVNNEKGYIPKQAEELIIALSTDNDVSYATAYEIGKFTALSDKGFSEAFFKWKHEVAAGKNIKKNAELAAQGKLKNFPQSIHLPVKHKYKDDLPIPVNVANKFNTWQLLQGIPIRYLVPDPRIVPTESIRYFKIDNNWVNAFIMGAFSIGHTIQVDFSDELNSLFLKKEITGFIFNSIAVAGWPDYELNCNLHQQDNVTPIYKVALDNYTHLYLFDGQIKDLNFHLHPGKEHPGFMIEKSDTGTTYLKSDANDVSVTINSNTKVIDLIALNKALAGNSASIGKFNSLLMEGTPNVKFSINLS